MAHWIVIPIKAPAECKTRLRGVLDDTARETLVADMLRTVLAACGAIDARLWLLGPHRHGLAETIGLLDDPGTGLNDALAAAMHAAVGASAERITFVSADLPDISAHDIARLFESEAAIAPDRHGTGTNALSLPLRAAAGFRFGYGIDSFSHHIGEARRLGLDMTVIRTAGLARDIDLPEDLTTASRTS